VLLLLQLHDVQTRAMQLIVPDRSLKSSFSKATVSTDTGSSDHDLVLSSSDIAADGLEQEWITLSYVTGLWTLRRVAAGHDMVASSYGVRVFEGCDSLAASRC